MAKTYQQTSRFERHVTCRFMVTHDRELILGDRPEWLQKYGDEIRHSLWKALGSAGARFREFLVMYIHGRHADKT